MRGAGTTDPALSSTQHIAADHGTAAAQTNSSTKTARTRSTQAHAVGKNFLAGGISGVSSTVLFQPFDVIKTHIQGSQVSPPPRIRDAVRFITTHQGITGLWAGTVPAFLRVGIGAGLYFSMLNPVLTVLSTGKLTTSTFTDNLHKKLPNTVVLGAGALTRSLAALVVCPITVLKTRMEYEAVSGIRYPNAIKALAFISRTEGLKGLYSGVVPTILRDAPYSGLYLLFYRSTRKTLSDWQGSEKASYTHLNFVAGAVAGASATILTHPPDVIRTKLQLESGEHSSLITSVRRVYQVHGVRGFFAGVVPRAGRRALHQAVAWTIYEELMGRKPVIER